MELREKIARRLCSASGSGGFCDCVGGAVGCKVGRGESFDGTNCAASSDQLVLSGYWVTAERILDIPEIRDALAEQRLNAMSPAQFGEKLLGELPDAAG